MIILTLTYTLNGNLYRKNNIWKININVELHLVFPVSTINHINVYWFYEGNQVILERVREWVREKGRKCVPKQKCFERANKRE